jgi:hypothetical protein
MGPEDRPGSSFGAAAAVSLLLVISLAFGWRTAQKWVGGEPVSDWTLALLFGVDPGRAEMSAGSIPDVPVRSHLRPCCAFGADLKVSVGGVSVTPGFKLGNVAGTDDLGPHDFDSSAIVFERAYTGAAPVTNEKNGLVYTCHGGFIDIAHVRDYADWTLYLSAQAGRLLSNGGGVIELPDEGGVRRIRVEPAEDALTIRPGSRILAVELGQWLAYQLSIWHEIVTWYGWSAIPAWPEKVSAFSPEDLYSNLVGVKVGAATIYDRAATPTSIYNRSMTYAIPRVLEHLVAVPRAEGREAMYAVDGVWWDSRKRLPAAELVLRRHIVPAREVEPWLVSMAGTPYPEGLAKHCPADSMPLALSYPEGLGSVRFRDIATLEIEVEEKLSEFPLPEGRRKIDQDDFAAIIESLRRENEAEFGPKADRPERLP